MEGLVSCLSQLRYEMQRVERLSAEGLRAWQLLVERYDPHIKSITAGQLLSLLQFDFSGDMLAKLEAYERDLALRWLACGDCSESSDGHRACNALVVEF